MYKNIILMAALLAAPAVMAQDSPETPDTKTMCIGNFDAPTDDEYREGMSGASWWERSPFQWYTKYSGIQIIYPATMLAQLAEDDAAITEVVFKYGDEGSTVALETDLTMLIENTEMQEFVKKPGTEDYMWVDYDPSTSQASMSYEVELYYYENEEIHFVLDKPMQYTGSALLVTAWSEVTNGVEAQSTVTYAVPTDGPTVMHFGSDRYDFARCYDTGIQEPYMGPDARVPVVKFVYTAAEGISSAIADDAAPAAIYDLNGRRIAGQPAPGIYIRRDGSRVSKIHIR